MCVRVGNREEGRGKREGRLSFFFLDFCGVCGDGLGKIEMRGRAFLLVWLSVAFAVSFLWMAYCGQVFGEKREMERMTEMSGDI